MLFRSLLTAFKAGQCAVFLVVSVIAISGLPDYDNRVRYIVVISLCYLLTSYFSYFTWSMAEADLNLPSLHYVAGTAPFVGTMFLVQANTLKRVGRWYWASCLPLVIIETILSIYGAIAAGLLMRMYLRTRTAMRYLIPKAAAMAVMLAFILIPEDPNAIVLGIKTVTEIMGGTGRFEVWEFALADAFWQAPLIGHGFVVGDALGRTSGVNVALGQMHNAHLSAVMNLGLLGAGLWFAFLIWSYVAIARHPVRETRIALAAAAVAYAIHQMFGGASLSSPLHPVWISHALFFSIIALEAMNFRLRRSLRRTPIDVRSPRDLGFVEWSYDLPHRRTAYLP